MALSSRPLRSHIPPFERSLWARFTKALQPPANDIAAPAVPSALVSFGSMLALVDIPEEPGNVVVLYEICWFSLARSERPRRAENLITTHIYMGPVMYWQGCKNVFPESVSAAWHLLQEKGGNYGALKRLFDWRESSVCGFHVVCWAVLRNNACIT